MDVLELAGVVRVTGIMQKREKKKKKSEEAGGQKTRSKFIPKSLNHKSI